jgi:hypothetical protein
MFHPENETADGAQLFEVREYRVDHAYLILCQRLDLEAKVGSFRRVDHESMLGIVVD